MIENYKSAAAAMGLEVAFQYDQEGNHTLVLIALRGFRQRHVSVLYEPNLTIDQIKSRIFVPAKRALTENIS